MIARTEILRVGPATLTLVSFGSSSTAVSCRAVFAAPPLHNVSTSMENSMARDWTDPRDGKTWRVSSEGRVADVGSGFTAQLLYFRGSEILDIIYEGADAIDDLPDVDLTRLIDQARMGKQRAREAE
jgi:hypothetical protein